MNNDALRAALSAIYQGNQDAVELALMLYNVAQVWDDIVDGDAVTARDVNAAFVDALVKMPTNRIYQLIPELPYHIYNVFLRWRDATNIENNQPSENDLHKCYMLRAGLFDIFVLIAAKMFGDDYAAEVGVTIRRLYGETFESYSQEFR
jgi:hypothetical protein